jgi:hypothetical protein
MSELVPASARPPRDRVGISVSAPDTATLLDVIQEAEAAGVAQLWMTQNPTSLDALTIFAAQAHAACAVPLDSGPGAPPARPRSW